MNKPALRQSMQHQRTALRGPERQALTAEWTQHALEYLIKRTPEPSSIAGYWPIRGEIDVRPLLEYLKAEGWRCALPRIPDYGRVLSFHQWGEQALVTGRYAIQEPPAHVPSLTPQILLVPLLAFDAHGHRLGYGGGYYDATLQHLTPLPLTLGCAYDFQAIGALPHEPHDHALDAIITPTQVIETTR